MKQNIANGTAMSRILGLSKPKEEVDYDKAEELYKKRVARLRQMEGDVQKGEYLPFNKQMPNQIRHDVQIGGEVQVKTDLSIPAQVSTSFVPYITSVGKQCLQPMAYGIKLMTLLFFVSCLFNSAALAQSHQEGGAVAEVGEIKPLKIGDTIPQELWHMPLQVINHAEGKDTITLNDYRDKKLIILDFWATWCGSCISAFPKLMKLSESYEDDLYLFPITRQPRDKIGDFLVGRGNDFKESFVYIVNASNVKPYFPHTVIPHVVVLANGRLHHLETAADMDENWINEILATSKSEVL